MIDFPALRAELAKAAYAGKTDQQALALLAANCPAMIPRPFTQADVMGCLDQATLQRIAGKPSIVQVIDAVLAQNRTEIRGLVDLGLAVGDLTQAQHDTIVAVLAATIPDPSGAVTVGSYTGPVSVHDIHAART